MNKKSRLRKYVTELDKTMYFKDDKNGVWYYVSAFWDETKGWRVTCYNLTIRDAKTKVVLDNTVMYTESDTIWGMKELSHDLRKWHVI